MAQKNMKGIGTNKAQRVRGHRKAWLMALALPVLLAMTWLFFTSPQNTKALEAEAEQAQAEELRDQYQSQLTALLAGQTPAAGVLLLTARDLDAQLPQTVSTIELVNQITTLAAASGVTVQQAVPGEGASSSAKQVAVTVNGSSNAVAQFLSQLQQAKPLMTVTNIMMTYAPPNTESSTITSTTPTGTTVDVVTGDTTATFTLSVWFHPDAPLAGTAAGVTPVDGQPVDPAATDPTATQPAAVDPNAPLITAPSTPDQTAVDPAAAPAVDPAAPVDPAVAPVTPAP